MRVVPAHIRTGAFFAEYLAGARWFTDGGKLDFPELPDEESCRKAVRNDDSALAVLPDEVKTYELCVEALVCDYGIGPVLSHVPERLKTPDFCLRSVRINGNNLAGVPESLMTYELCLEAVRNNPFSLQCVSLHLMSNELALLAVRKWGDTLEFVPLPFRTPEIYLEAISHSEVSGVMRLVPPEYRTKENYLLMFRNQRHVTAIDLRPLRRAQGAGKKTH